MEIFKRKKVGLALSGGGARGLAHIGVLKVFEENKIPIDMIAGTSMGAVIGALYSLEPNYKKIEKEVLEKDWKELFDYTISRMGLIKGNKLYDFFKKRLNDVSFSELKIPLYVTSFDLKNKQELIFSKGNLAKALRASISIPGIFFPIEEKGEILIDGGIVDLIPTEVLKKNGADIIIAVNVLSVKEKETGYNQEISNLAGNKNIPTAFKTLPEVFQIMQSKAADSEISIENIDLVITPNVDSIGLLEFSKSKQAIEAGEKAAKKSLKKIVKLTSPNAFKELLNNLNPQPNIDSKK